VFFSKPVAASRKLSLRGGKRLQPMPGTAWGGWLQEQPGIHTLVRAPESQAYPVVGVRRMCGGDQLRHALGVAWLPTHQFAKRPRCLSRMFQTLHPQQPPQQHRCRSARATFSGLSSVGQAEKPIALGLTTMRGWSMMPLYHSLSGENQQLWPEQHLCFPESSGTVNWLKEHFLPI